MLDIDRLVALGNATEAPYPWIDNSTLPLIRIVQAINLYLIPVISVLGVFGGICSCLVFTFTTFQYQPCSQYLAVLTASDSGFLIALLIAWLTTVHPNLAKTPGYCQVMVYMTYTCSFLSAWYLVLLMVERYITVCHPLRAPVLCTKRHARLAIASLTMLALLLYSHSFVTTDWVRSPQDSPCKQNERHMRFLAIFTYVDFVATFFLPFILVLFLNLRIILAVRSFRRRHRPLPPSALSTTATTAGGGGEDEDLALGEGGSRGGGGAGGGAGSGSTGSGASRGQRTVQYCLMSHAQVRSTKLLVWVATVFLVLYLPSHALRMYMLIWVSGTPGAFSVHLMMAQQVCQFIYYINFAVDFVVFSVSSKSFRRNIARCLRRL